MAVFRLAATAFLLAWPTAAGSASEPVAVPFALVEPRSGATVHGGATVPVSVSVGPDSGTRQVSYFWYRQEEEPASFKLAEPALVADARATPPFGGELPVPVEALGPMRILAVAEVAQGRMDTVREFDERVVLVESTARLEAIEFTVEKPWAFTPVGRLASAPVVGLFSDGVTRALDGPGVGTRLHSTNDSVVQILEGTWIRASGPGRAALEVENRGRRARLDVIVTGDAEENRVPRANPGEDQRVKSGGRVLLRGVLSVDPDGDPLRYEWTQVRGTKVDLTGPNESAASFVAPWVSATRLLRFRLRVTDMKGPDTIRGADSLPAYVNVWVEP